MVPLSNLVCVQPSAYLTSDILTSMNVDTPATIQTPTAIASKATSIHEATGAVESRRWVSHHCSQDVPKEREREQEVDGEELLNKVLFVQSRGSDPVFVQKNRIWGSVPRTKTAL